MTKATAGRKGRSGKERPGPAPPGFAASSAAAERDLLAAILETAGQRSQTQLPAIAAALARYSGCRCAGIIVLDAGGASSAASCDAGPGRFRRHPGASFPGPQAGLCGAVLAGQPFIRNRRPKGARAAGAPFAAAGLCSAAALFESVALVPVEHGGAALGFMFMGDERPNRIPPRAAAFLPQVGRRMGATVRAPAAFAGGSGGQPPPPGAEALSELDLIDLVSRLIENANDAIVISQDWRVLYVNQRFAEALGRPRQDIIGSPLLEMAFPDDHQALMDRYNWIAHGQSMPSETVVRGLDGQGRTRWLGIRDILFSWNGRPAIIHLISDISDRVRVQEELRRSEERYRLLVETANEAIAVVQDGLLAFVSPRIEQISGYSVSELVGQPFADFVHPDDLPVMAERHASRLRDEEASRSYETRLKTRAGGIWWADINAVLLDWEGRPSVLALISDITQWKMATQALKESEERYRLLADNAVDVIFAADLKGRPTYVSPSVAHLLGLTVEEALQFSLSRTLLPDSMEWAVRSIVEQLHSDVPGGPGPRRSWTMEVEMLRKDGARVWTEVIGSFTRAPDGTPVGIMGVVRDITARRRMEQDLEESERRYRLLAENASDVIFTADLAMKPTYVSPSAVGLTGYTIEEIYAGDMDAWLVPGSREPLMEAYRRLLARARAGAELSPSQRTATVELARKDGGAVWTEARIDFLRDAAGQVTGLVGVARDIADRRKIDEMKDEFIGLVSHELRSPLTIIIGALHTAISEGPRLSRKETGQLLQDAAMEAEQLAHLVGNLLELSRAQANRLVLHVEPINLAKTVHNVVSSVQRQSPRHRFLLDLPATLPPVSADQIRLERVLRNLLENSARYSPQGTQIKVSARQEAGDLVLSVSDRGPGISKEDQSRLFKAFQQLGDPRLHHAKGAGLGLLVCRRLVEAHGGRIWVESEPGHGATFSFTIRATPAAPPPGP